ncbi:MAG: asparagine synthase-related protein [Candidatus Bathyarchaeia archaeon]
MGAISAIKATDGLDVTRLLKRMMSIQSHRGSDLFGVSTSKECIFTHNLDELDELKPSHAAIAYNLMKIDDRDRPQPFVSGDLSLIIEYDYTEFEGSHIELLDYLNGNIPEHLARFLTEYDGQYAVVVLNGEEIYAARDPVGLKPLYYTSTNNIAALASEKKALWSIGLSSTSPFPPGNLWRLDEAKPSPVREVSPQNILVRDTHRVTMQLTDLLKEAVYERTGRLSRIGICFSGGVDSSAITYLLSKLDIDMRTFIVGLEGSPAIDSACEAAEMLGVEAIVREYNIDDLEDALWKCLWRIEESNIVKLGFAIPLSWCANLARENDFSDIVSGQGADELFCGYRKFLNIFREVGEKGLEEATVRSVRDAHEMSFQVVEQAVAPERVRMLHPFADWKLITFSLTIPTNMKIQGPGDILRKRILRDTCMKLGLPREIAEEPKRAIQYSTGVDKGMRIIAKRRGFKTQAYVKAIFNELFNPVMEGYKRYSTAYWE